MTPVRLAVFDVDGTLVDGQTQAMMVRHMSECNMIGLPTRIAVALWFIAYRLGIPVSGEGIRRLVLRSLRGMTRQDVATLADDLFEARLRERVRRQGAKLISDYRERGFRTVLLSASAEPIVSRIAREVGASDWIATNLDVADDCLTGEIDGAVVEGEEKAARLTAWADAKFENWVLHSAYGDHESDAQIMRLAEISFAVNPTAALRRLAAENGWACLEW